MTDRERERTGRCKSGDRDGEEEKKTHGGEWVTLETSVNCVVLVEWSVCFGKICCSGNGE